MHKKNSYDFCLFSIPPDGKRVIWEITNTCNYACSYCIFSSGAQKHTDELTTQEVIRTLKEFKKSWITDLKITWGEPFIRKDMIDILTYAAQEWFTIDISTNASLITDEIAEKLSKIHLKYIHISLDSHKESTQSLVRGTWSFARTCAWIRYLVHHGIYTRIGTLIFQKNEKEIHAMIKFLIKLNVSEVIFSLMEPVGRMMGNNKIIATRKISSLIQEIESYQKTYQKKIKIWYAFTPENNSLYTNKTSQTAPHLCPGADKFYYINNKGQVSPCTWIVQFLKEFQSTETLKTQSFQKITRQWFAIKKFRELITRLASYGLTWCPKSFLSIFKECTTIQELFSGDFENNITKNGKYSNCSRLYAFATENISWYYPLCDFKDKHLLSVGSSWDHAINALCLWAKHVDCFDINLLSKFFIDLKCTALKYLNFTTFKNFFFRNTSHAFSKTIYDKLAPYLQISSRYFFDELYRYYTTWLCIRESILFNNIYDTKEAKINNNIYVKNNSQYLAARQAIKKNQIYFMHSSLQDICQNNILAEKKYDAILLSNISDYSKNMFPDTQYLQTFKTEIVDYLLQHTAKCGLLMIGYVYESNPKTYRSSIDNPDLRKKIFSYKGYKEIEIPSVLDPNQKDIFIYVKKNHEE